MTHALRRTGLAVLTVAMALGGLVVTGATASATAGDIGFQDQSYSGAPNAPTSDKPQSKLWFAQGAWWADMFDTASKTWHIFRLDRSREVWVDTGVPIDDRANTLADVLWDGTHLYVASHVVTISSESSTNASVPNSPARLYRYSYSSATNSYRLDAGFPAQINNNSSESLTLGKDSTGRLWATWTQVTSTASGYTNAVYANSTNGSDSSWGTPFVVPVNGSTVSPDDISSVVSFAKNKVGIVWSNQLDGGVYFAVHNDGAPTNSWVGGPAVRGTALADDHVNIKAVQADNTGRVFAVIKTSLDTVASPNPADPQIELLTYQPGTAKWSVATVSTLADCGTRPQLVLDETNQMVHVFDTAPSSGCPFTGAAGTIFDKTASMANPVFAPGRGTPVMRDAASANLNDVTTTKQSATAASGIVVMASNQVTQRYWHADLSAPATPVPVASFTATPTNGIAPVTVQFTDTSTGAPTSWAWDFGDGATASTQNPSHTYTTPGTYTVGLKAINGGGTAAATATVTVNAPVKPGSGIVARSSSTAMNTAAVTDITIPRPVGVAAGDLLVAQITANMAPTMATVPAGWTPVLAKTLNIAGEAQVFVYSHVVGDPAAEPASDTWQLSVAEKWGAGMTAFAGVDGTNPFDTDASTVVDTTYAATKLTVPGVTTDTNGAALIGGVGLDNKSVTVSSPSGWTEAWQSSGAKVAELARGSGSVAGPTGDVSWTLSSAAAGAAWIRALRPAPVQAPVASFTSTPTAGTAPMAVQFTDTSTGVPTSWAWDFGDGATATSQNPSHTYTTAGTYTATLTVTNAGGSATATAAVTVKAAAPKASFTTSTTTGTAPVAVKFTDTSTGAPTSWTWNFGDGATATTQNASHTYAEAGTYQVTLTVTNASGSSTSTATVEVKAQARGLLGLLTQLLELLSRAWSHLGGFHW